VNSGIRLRDHGGTVGDHRNNQTAQQRRNNPQEARIGSKQISFVFHNSIAEQIVEPNLRNIGDGVAFIGDLREQLRRPDFQTDVPVNRVLLFVNTDVAHAQHHRSLFT